MVCFKETAQIFKLVHDGGSLTYRNQSIELFYKSMDWFLYDRNFTNFTMSFTNFT